MRLLPLAPQRNRGAAAVAVLIPLAVCGVLLWAMAGSRHEVLEIDLDEVAATVGPLPAGLAAVWILLDCPRPL